MIIIASQDKTRKNEEIKASVVMVIDVDGTNLGNIPTEDALSKAYNQDLDLVEVSSDEAEQVVCRIMDYGKFLYEKGKKEKENKKKSKQKQLKEMKFHCNIGVGDYQTKKKHITKFINEGYPVRIVIMFRGREMSHPELGMELLNKLIDELEGLVNVQAAPKMEGRNMTMTVVPVKK